MYCTMDNAGSMVVVIYRGKSREVCTVLLDKGLFLKNQTTLAKNTPSGPLKNCRSRVSFIALDCSD